MSDVASFLLVFGGVLALVIFLTVVGIAIICSKAEEAKQHYQSVFDEKVQQEQAELAKKKRELEREARDQQEEQARQAECALAEAVEDIRRAAEERYRSGIPDGNLDDVDQYLKNVQLRQSHMGRVLTVRVVVLPTGRMALEWALDPTLPYLLQVVGEKNEKTVFVEHAWRGVYPDTLVRGREYVFRLHAYDGNKDKEDNFRFTVKAPTQKQWDRKVNQQRIEGAVEREQRIVKQIEFIEAEDALWEKARQAGHKRIDASDVPEPEKRKRKARLDVKVEEERQCEEDQTKKKRDRR